MGPDAAADRRRDAADRDPRGDGAGRDQGRRRAPARDLGRDRRARPRSSRREIWELAGREFTIGSPQQLSRGALQRARADQEAPRQDRLLDRRPRARADPRRAPDRREGRALARADEAQEHLPRLAAGADRPRDRAHPHDLQPGRDDDRAGSRAPTRTCRTSRSAPRSGAPSAPPSSPSRDSGCCRPTTTRSSCGCSPTSPTRRCCARSSPRARTSTRRPRPSCSTPTPTRSAPASARRRRWSITGSPTGCRRSGSPTGCRSTQEEAAGLHRPLLRALPGGQDVHRRDDRERTRGGLRDDADGAPPADPRAARAPAPDAACWASGSPSTR